MNTMKTVLVIDDETATLTMFRLFLNTYGYAVLTAENGAAGLRLVREHHPGTALFNRLLAEARAGGTSACIAGLSENFKAILLCACGQKQTCGVESESV